jgi:hypothetical protein
LKKKVILNKEKLSSMLLIEALAGVLCVAFALVAVARLRSDRGEPR